MKVILLLLLLMILPLVASSEYSLRLAQGKATNYDLGEILTGKIGKFRDEYRVYSLDGAYLLAQSFKNSPFDIYLQSGMSIFTEGASKDNVYEMTIYLKAFWNIDFMDNRVRIGLGEGFSYTSAVLAVEREDALSYSDNNSHLLNYLDMSADFNVGLLCGVKRLDKTYIGVLIKHRSGIFGLINNVRHGGSNYPSVYIETNF